MCSVVNTHTRFCFSQFDLVCSDQWKQPFTSTVFFVGVLVGSFFSGQLSDRYGQLRVMLTKSQA